MVIDRYILREILYTLLAVLAILLVVFISNRFVRYLADIGTAGVEAVTAMTFLGLKTLSAMVIILPLGLFMAVLLAFSRLYKDSEMTALAACGVSIRRVYRSVLVLALVVAGLVAAVSFFAAPWAEEESYQLRDAQQAHAALSNLAPGRFTDLGGGGMLYFQRSAPDGAMHQIFAQQQRHGNPIVLAAKRGYMRNDAQGRQSLVFEDGYRYEGTPGKTNFRVIEFAEHTLRVEQRDVRPSFRKQRALSNEKLLASWTNADIAELQWRISMPLSVVVLAILAVPVSRTSPRQGKYAKLFVAVLIYLIYNNLMGMANSWVARGVLAPQIGMWWVHLAILVGVWILFIRQYGLSWVLASMFKRQAQ